MSEILANIPVELNEEDIIFTEEQQEKIEQMRKARAQLKTRETYVTNLNRFHDNPFIVGKPVFVNIEGTEFIGHIEKVDTSDKSITFYNVVTPHGILKKLTRNNLRSRIVKDLSDVKVPEKLEKLSAQVLLKLLNNCRKNSDRGYAAFEKVIYNEIEIKAALVGKPHISNKRENKKVRKFKQRSK